MSTHTIRYRIYSDPYGSGREIEITATSYQLSSGELAEHKLDPARPWAIMLSGSDTRYGPGGAVLNVNRAEWDPDGEWRNEMTAVEPTGADCQCVAEIIYDSYLQVLGEAGS